MPRAQAREELRRKTTTLGEDLAGIFGSGFNVLACCVAHDPEKVDRRQERKKTFLDSQAQRRGVGQIPQVVGVGVILNHTSRHSRNGLFVDSFVDGPAKECNRIFPGDQLLSVDNHDVETSRIEDLTYLLPGPPGTKVVMEFREPGGKTKSVQLVRNLGCSSTSARTGLPSPRLQPGGTSGTAVPVIPVDSMLPAREPSQTPEDFAEDFAHRLSTVAKPKGVLRNPGGTFVGVGIEFEENKAENSIRVSGVMARTPASECGKIFVSDILMRVDDVDTRGWSLLTLADNVLGPPDTTLKLTFMSSDSPSGVKDVLLIRRAPGELPRAVKSPRGLEKVSFTA